MPFGAPFTATAGAVLTSAIWNIVRDDLNYHQGLLDGTGGAVTVTTPDRFQVAADNNFALYKSGTAIVNLWDTGDALVYQRSTNVWSIQIGGADKLLLDANGKLTGAGFYDSGEVALATGASTNLSHGLTARPRVVIGWFNTASGVPDSKTGPVPLAVSTTVPYISAATGTVVSVTNPTAGTRYVQIYAIL
jgi:hypothetical protein